MVAPIVLGLRRAVRLPGLAALLWCANLLFAAFVAVPFWLRLHGAIAAAPAGDRLLDGFSFGLFADLAREHGGMIGPLMLAVLPLFGVMLLVNAFTAGGVLEVLTAGRPGTVFERFAAGGARFFWRFLRVGVLAGVLLAVAAGVILAATAAATRTARGSEWEPAPLVGWSAGLALAGLAVVVVLLALDLARVRVVRDDRRRVMRAWFGSLWLVLRHPVATVGLWLAVAALFATVLALYLGLRQVLPATTWGGIAAMLLLQQAVVLARAALRVALFAGEIEVVERLLPVVPDPVPAPPAEEPSLELAPRELPLAE